MPIKFNLTKYDMLSTKVKKASVKKDANQMTPEEKAIVLKAVLIASFSSGHSWQTFKALTSPTPTPLNRPEIKQEHVEARSNKWRTITPFNIVEVSNMNISEKSFSEWLFFNVERDQHDDYKNAWTGLRGDFERDCDHIEREK